MAINKEKSTSEKKLATNNRYLNQLEEIKIRVPKGYKDVIKQFAVDQNYNNVNQLIIGLINEKMEQIGYSEKIPTGMKEVKAEKQSETE